MAAVRCARTMAAMSRCPRPFPLFALLALAATLGCAKAPSEWRADLEAGEPHARLMAVVALGEVGGERDVAALVGALDDPHAPVRERARRVLARRGASVVDLLVERLLGGDEAMVAVLAALGERAAPPLVEALRTAREPEDVARLAGALAAVGPPAREALEEVLAGRRPRALANAALALGRFGERARAAVPRLLALAERDEPLVRRCALEALASIAPDDPAVRARLLRAAGDEAHVVRKVALAAIVDALLDDLASDDRARVDAARAAAAALDAQALPAWLDALREGRPGAADGLVARGPDVVPALLELVGERKLELLEEVGGIVAALGPEGARDATAVLADPASGARVQAATVLGAAGVPVRDLAVPALREVLADDATPLELAVASAYALARLVPDEQASLARLRSLVGRAEAPVLLALERGLKER